MTARGKFLYAGASKLYVKGVTYGTFAPQRDGCQFPEPEAARQDLATMAANGINAVRTYTTPPRWLLDLAWEQGLRVMAGLPWEQHVTFLDTRQTARDIQRRVREAVRSCAGHPAVLCYAVGNEIPAPIVRWHGPKRVAGFLRELFEIAKNEDPERLVTYVNYPTTEYLDLPFLDLVCFNVYLESREALAGYLARLQNIAGERPLLMAEVGLDSRRNGQAKQADTLRWQVRQAFESGCAGVFAFAWTDEWHRGGYDITNWDFGLTTRSRVEKPALSAVQDAYAEVPFPAGQDWPRISVVVCSHNGAATIGETLEHLRRMRYPNYEVIVVDDGSRDATAEIAGRFGVRLIQVPNSGLSKARNRGLEAATGEIVAYIDDDAYPDPDWLYYLAQTFLTTEFAGVGGPNIPPPDDGRLARVVAESPGGPAHVLLTDTIAEHIPGCNMAFRRECLLAIGGFDRRFRVAGDDVDVCWRLQQQGWELGFHPAAVVWHHRRGSIRKYWRQQRGYGSAEGLLARKWPEKYNATGHLSWGGRVYGRGQVAVLGRRQRVYHGIWGSAPFQSVYREAPGRLGALLLMPEWYLILAFLFPLAALGALWKPLLLASAVFTAGAAATVWQALRSGLASEELSFPDRLLTSGLYLIQPAARLLGRMFYGLTPWRARRRNRPRAPLPAHVEVWSTRWKTPEEWLSRVEGLVYRNNASVSHAGPFDRWDLEVHAGPVSGVRAVLAVEEHGAGQQLLRFRIRPVASWTAILVTAVLGLLCGVAIWERAPLAVSVVLGWMTLTSGFRLVHEAAVSLSVLVQAIQDAVRMARSPDHEPAGSAHKSKRGASLPKARIAAAGG